MPERSFRPLLYALAVFGLLADQATKYGVFAWLAERPGHSYTVFRDPAQAQRAADPSALPERERGFFLEVLFEDEARRTPHVNHGALFGFLRDYETLANMTFAVVSLAAAVGILWWSRQRSCGRDWLLCAALGLILGGTLGNLYDRVLFNGVRDFLHWNYLFDWPVFNVADCCLVFGATLMLLQAFFGKSAPAEPVQPAATESVPLTAEVGASAHVTTASKG
jgi:lipoprotein signal peptidase